jgi:hypothetical protein
LGDEDSNDDVEINYEDNEDIESEDDEVNDIGVDNIMLSTPARKNRSAKKSTPASSVSAVTNSLKKMSVRSSHSPPFQFDCVYPYTMSTYDEGDDEMCDLFFLVSTLPLDYFVPDVVNQGNVFSVATRTPNFFFTFKRILQANNSVFGFNKNTSQAQAYKKVCDHIDNHHGHRDVIYGNPQFVPLPFSCEERIVHWEIQASKNNLGELSDQLGGRQFHSVLWAKLCKVKGKKRTVGKFRIIDDDQQDDDNFMDDDENNA